MQTYMIRDYTSLTRGELVRDRALNPPQGNPHMIIDQPDTPLSLRCTLLILCSEHFIFIEKEIRLEPIDLVI